MRVKVAALREGLAKILAAVREPVVIVRHGEPVAAIVSLQDLEELNRLRGMYRTVPNRQHTAVRSTASANAGQPERPLP